MKSPVKYLARPKLNTPNMLASWPGVSNVSITVATYLQRKLGFKKLAEIRAAHFFDPVGVAVRNNLIEAPQFPKSDFYYWKNRGHGSDLILFIGEAQPPSRIYELANLVIDVAQKYQVKRLFTCAAALTRMHYTEQPRVWGAATKVEVAESLKEYELTMGGQLQIAGLNGLLLGIAKERKLDGVCLLGEVPTYLSRIPNPMAALAIMRILSKMLSIPIDTGELAGMAVEAKEQMKQASATAMSEYIDYFTEPIWEYGESDEDVSEED